MKDKIFGVLQRIGKSFMLPIATLPVAGFLITIGQYGLKNTSSYNMFNYIFLIMKQSGVVIFNNLPIIFAVGVAIGMANKEKEMAAISSAISFLVMNKTISTLIYINGGVLNMYKEGIETVCGIETFKMGILGGVIVGIGVAILHNRFSNISLPEVIGFFSGSRLIPIISSLVYVLVGVVLFYVWPEIQNGVYYLGSLVRDSGYAGTFLYGFIERMLIPYGLHHIFYVPFWQTGIGGSEIISGITVSGAQNIFFSELAEGNYMNYSAEAGRFMAGKFPFMMFGLPGAALAMYSCAKEEKKKKVFKLLMSAVLVCSITGITEPLEFTFLFVSPVLYIVHSVLAGLSYMIMHMLNVAVGMTFSGGLIDLLLYGVLPGNKQTNWIYIIIVGVVYFILYYVIFKILILKFDYKTPGRESDDEEIKLYTLEDVNNKSDKKMYELIIEGLGGKEIGRAHV